MGPTVNPHRLFVLGFLMVVSLVAPSLAQQSTKKTEPATKQTPTNTTEAQAVRSSGMQLPPVLSQARDFTKLVLPKLGRQLLQAPFPFTNEPAAKLRSAIMSKLGIRYRFYGTGDNGYDCSGLVWKVFQEAGANFQRVAARSLWTQLPPATATEAKEFGTLVFFNDLKHVGIVRDDKTFFHASTSKGVTISEFSGYWEKRINGYRKAPLAMLPQILEAVE